MKSKQPLHLNANGSGAAITVRITPRASRNEIHEILNDGTLKIRLAASAEAEINQQLVEFIAKVVGAPADRVEIVVGSTSNDKLVSILGLSPREVHEKVLKALS
jgi:uncharacterized protein YggU (UPF0235/DUF167 family)